MPAVRKSPAPTTEAAIANVCRSWTHEFSARFAGDAEGALLDYEEAVLGDAASDDGLPPEHQNSLPSIWGAFFRPMEDGRSGVELARGWSRFRAPVLAAAVERMAAARGTLADVVHLDRKRSIVTLRDVFDGTLYRVSVDAGFGKKLTRWLRLFGILVDRGDGMWSWPSVLFGGPWHRNVEPRAFVDAVRAQVAAIAFDDDLFAEEMPYRALARWAGVAYGVLLNLAEPSAEEIEEQSKKMFLVNTDGERVELSEGSLRITDRAAAQIAAALDSADDFVNDGDAWDWRQERAGKLEDIASISRNDAGAWRANANSGGRLSRLVARLQEVLGSDVSVTDVAVTRPWEKSAGCVAEESADTRRVMSASHPVTLDDGERPADIAARTAIEVARNAVDSDIPALGGRPRDLARDPEGRARVERWLRDFETRGIPGKTIDGAYFDLDPLRRELGLEPALSREESHGP